MVLAWEKELCTVAVLEWYRRSFYHDLLRHSYTCNRPFRSRHLHKICWPDHRASTWPRVATHAQWEEGLGDVYLWDWIYETQNGILISYLGRDTEVEENMRISMIWRAISVNADG